MAVANVPVSAPHPQRADQAAQAGDGAQRRDLAGAWVLRPHVFDRHREACTIRIDFDVMDVAGDSRVGPDLEAAADRPNPPAPPPPPDVDLAPEPPQPPAPAAP